MKSYLTLIYLIFSQNVLANTSTQSNVLNHKSQYYSLSRNNQKSKISKSKYKSKKSSTSSTLREKNPFAIYYTPFSFGILYPFKSGYLGAWTINREFTFEVEKHS